MSGKDAPSGIKVLIKWRLLCPVNCAEEQTAFVLSFL